MGHSALFHSGSPDIQPFLISVSAILNFYKWYKKYVKCLSGNWTAYIAKACLYFEIYAVQLLKLVYHSLVLMNQVLYLFWGKFVLITGRRQQVENSKNWKESTCELSWYLVYFLGLYQILIWPDIRPIILPDTGYPAWPDTGYPAK